MSRRIENRLKQLEMAIAPQRRQVVLFGRTKAEASRQPAELIESGEVSEADRCLEVTWKEPSR
jgi:hypothetical protein